MPTLTAGSEGTHHLVRVRGLMDLASRWCPDATADSREEAIRRFAFESAHAHGLAYRWSLPVEPSAPTGLVRQLLDAAEELLARAPEWDWPVPDSPIHPSGFGMGPDKTCGVCAWLSAAGCVQLENRGNPPSSVDASTPACSRWEPVEAVGDCIACGACCREGYDYAPVEADEAAGLLHPHLVTTKPDGMRRLDRPGGLCVALDRSVGNKGFPCTIYRNRPKACAQLAPGSLACLVARKRVGLSR
ncbi:MAG: YkgJ family cysteine cluster protein [Fibrobacteres bacterium]|nr:YkgJ family cysteine cluster protein [Fibrobacterota bacterium]